MDVVGTSFDIASLDFTATDIASRTMGDGCFLCNCERTNARIRCSVECPVLSGSCVGFSRTEPLGWHV